MRTAICFAGEMRTLEKTLPLMEERIFSRFSNYDIFFFTWTDDPDLRKIKYLLKTNKVKDFDLEERVNFDENIFFPKKPLDINWQFIPRQLYCIKRVNDIKSNYEKENNFKYDIVMRIRPDLLIINDTWLDKDIEKQDMHNLYLMNHDDWHGYCDRLYISNSENIDIISNGIEKLSYYSEMGGRSYGEGFLQFIFHSYIDTPIKRLSLETCLLRNNGEMDGELILIKNKIIEKHADGKIWHIPNQCYI